MSFMENNLGVCARLLTDRIIEKLFETIFLYVLYVMILARKISTKK